MDSTTIGRLRESISLLPIGDLGPVQQFYVRLFELAPDARTLFTGQIDLQAKKFADMLAWIIAHMEKPDQLCEEMRALGARHNGYGVRVDHYAPVGSALIWMFQHALGNRFTPEMEEAWLEAYAFISLEAERGSRELVTVERPGSG
jgi:hemoglobin-like flavoprotein